MPWRVHVFLRGLGICAAARAAMARAGYTDQDHAEGWLALQEACGYSPGKATPTVEAPARRGLDAQDEIARWEKTSTRRIRAALDRIHPEQSEFVFEGLRPAREIGAEIAAALLLERLAALEYGRIEATRDADRAALATLARRGFTPEERARAASLVKLASGLGPAPVLPDLEPSAGLEAALKRLYAWYTDWSQTARTAILCREHLIRLGLAQRRRSAKAASPAARGAETEPADG